MIEVVRVDRDAQKIAKVVVIRAGQIEKSYRLNEKGEVIVFDPRNLGSQILDDQSLITSPVDYCKAMKRAGAILREKRRKVPTR